MAEPGQGQGTDAAEPELILLTEDNPINRQQARRVIERMGYRAVEATNGREAYEKATQLNPFFILMDVMMPVMDGLTAIRLLRADSRTKGIPIVVQTSLAGDGDCQKCLDAGANGYIAKPVMRKSLERAIEAYRAGEPIGNCT